MNGDGSATDDADRGDAITVAAQTPTSTEDAVALEIRRLRLAAGLSQNALAKKAGFQRQYISRAENPARGLPSGNLIAVLDVVLAAGGNLVALHDIASGGRRRRRADILRRAGTSGPDATESSETIDEATPRLSGVALGALLHDFRPMGCGEVKPVEYLSLVRSTLVDNDNLFGPRLVVPLVEQHIASISASCENLRGNDRDDMLRLRARFAEFNAWLYQDLGHHAAARFWLDRAFDWAFCDVAELPAYILARKSQLAADMGDAATAIGVGGLAITSAASPRMRAIATTYTAHSFALGGQAGESERLYDSARELVSSTDDGPDPSLGSWLNEPYIEVHRAGSLDVLGQHADAAGTFTAAIAGLGPGFRRDRGVYLARAANAYARADDVDRASEMGSTALGIARDTCSGRTLAELRRLTVHMPSTVSASAAAFHQDFHRLRSAVPIPQIEAIASR